MATRIAMRKAGELVQWNNRGGYGFIRDDTGRDYYLHISNVAERARPRIGDRLSFAAGPGRNGRPAAIDAIVTESVPEPQQTLRDLRKAPERVSPYKIGLRVMTATVMTLLIVWAIGANHAPSWLGLVYAGMGTASALLYRFDKLYAMSGRYRVSENNLRLVDFCFGIIGGLAAQELYRHKTVKPSFVASTWLIALVHTVALAALAFGLFDAVFGYRVA